MPTKNKKSLPIPRVGTKAAENYFSSHISITRFFNWVLYMAGKMDEMSDIAHKALVSVEDDENKKNEMETKWKEKKGMIDELKYSRQFFLEVILVRYVENYLNFLSDLLFEIFTQRPETLRSSEKVELSQVLQFNSIDEFVLSAAERKVESLSYSSFNDLGEYFLDRFDLVLFEESSIPKVIDAIETRNISVHNRCVINARYCKRTGKDRDVIGDRRNLYGDDIEEIKDIFFNAVKSVDKQTRKKLKVKGVRFDLSS